ncbi:MAG TPA: phospholipid carrier-dependent glycosyltransferase [Candidatus Deferrimicrobium sp.]|nr:phospholipid carrier-dependent glycosyltransferase [Candidatus Deferrimicrobium sp.]
MARSFPVDTDNRSRLFVRMKQGSHLSMLSFRSLVILFVVALAARLIWWGLMIQQVPPEQLLQLTPDVKQYTTSAEAIRSQFDFDTQGVVVFGPGYPAWLALLGLVLSPHPYWLLFVQIFLSAFSSVLVALFALDLTEDKPIAFAAGYLNALSMTSIWLANILLSETMFFFFLVFGLLAFLKGLRTDRGTYFLSAALLLSVATFTRSMGQFLFLVLLGVTFLHHWSSMRKNPKAVTRKLVWPLVASTLMVAVVAAWTLRNDHLYGFRQLALSASGGQAHLVRVTRETLDHVSYTEASASFDAEIQMLQDDSLSYYAAFDAHSQNSLRQLIREHPLLVARIYAGNVLSELNDEWGLQHVSLPRWSEQLRALISWIHKKGLNYRVSLLAVIGTIILVRKRKYQLLLILSLIYLYFALIAGFSHWQGSRIFYHGQIAWAILIAYPLIWLYRQIGSKIRTRHS